MSIGANERVALKGEILEYARLIFDRTPPLDGELPNLGSSLRNARDKATFTIDDADQPIRRYVVRAEKALKPLLFHGDAQDTKRLVALEDGNLDSGDPIVRERTSKDPRYDNGARCEGPLLSLKPDRITLGQRLVRRDQSVHKLLAAHIGNQNPNISSSRELSACLDLESIEIVIEQLR